MIPALDAQSITYDFDTAVDWIRRNPGQPLPGSSTVTSEEQLTFDFPHINTVLDRLGELRTLITREQLRFTRVVARERVPEGYVNLHNAALDIVVQNGHMTAQENSQGNESLDFTRRLLRMCGEAYAVGFTAKNDAYQSKLAQILAMSTGEEPDPIRIEAEFALNDRLRGIKRIHYEEANAFNGFFINLFGGNTRSYIVGTYIDQRIAARPPRILPSRSLTPPD